MIISSYDDTDSEDSHIDSEVEMKLLRIWNRLQLRGGHDNLNVEIEYEDQRK